MAKLDEFLKENPKVYMTKVGYSLPDKHIECPTHYGIESFNHILKKKYPMHKENIEGLLDAHNIPYKEVRKIWKEKEITWEWWDRRLFGPKTETMIYEWEMIVVWEGNMKEKDQIKAQYMLEGYRAGVCAEIGLYAKDAKKE